MKKEIEIAAPKWKSRALFANISLYLLSFYAYTLSLAFYVTLFKCGSLNVGL